MNLIYKDYEYPSLFLGNSGYLIHDCNYLNENFWGEKTNHDGITYIKPENNICYFDEADVVTKINNNEENYFDFSKNIIDIGGYAGCYSFRTFFNNAYTFEPNKIMYHIICVNLIIQNKFDKAKVYNVCLSDKNEELKYDGFKTLQDNEELFNDLSSEEDNSRYIDNIYTHILDEYNCENVGLIKVDVEGMEEKVLRGGLGTIVRNNYPPILFECWDVGYCGMTEEKHNSLEHFLTDLGYSILWYWGDHQTHLAIHY